MRIGEKAEEYLQGPKSARMTREMIAFLHGGHLLLPLPNHCFAEFDVVQIVVDSILNFPQIYNGISERGKKKHAKQT